MHLMQTRMTEVRSRPVDAKTEAWNHDSQHEKLSPYVGHIYQIKFDAWTFAKSDLWASLMQTIFFELDRQLTLEKSIETALKQRKEDALKGTEDPEQRKQIEQTYDQRNQEIEQQIWPVLYKSNNDEREWFLKRILKEDDLLNAIESSPNQGGLWQTIDDVQKEDKERLRQTRQQLEKIKSKLNQDCAKLRQTTLESFQPLLEIQKNESVRHIDALLGTSFELLRRRIGPKLFQDLNEQIQLELYGPPDSETKSPEKVREKGLWGQLNNFLIEVEDAREKLRKVVSCESEDEGSNSEHKSSIDSASEDSATSPPTTKTGSDDQDAENKKTQEIEEQKQEIENLLRKVTATKLDILDIATTVVEQNYCRVIWATAWHWIRRNWITLLLTATFVLAIISLLVFYELKPVEASTRLVTRLATLIAPTLPTVILLRNLLKSGTAWFEETRLAFKEYEKSVEQKK